MGLRITLSMNIIRRERFLYGDNQIVMSTFLL